MEGTIVFSLEKVLRYNKKQVNFECDGIKNVLVRRKGGTRIAKNSTESEFGEENVERKGEIKDDSSFTFLVFFFFLFFRHSHLHSLSTA